MPLPASHLLFIAGWALAKQNQELDDLAVAVEKAAAAAAAAGSNAAAGRDLGDIDADLQAAESQLRHAEIGRDDLVKRHSKLKVKMGSGYAWFCPWSLCAHARLAHQRLLDGQNSRAQRLGHLSLLCTIVCTLSSQHGLGA